MEPTARRVRPGAPGLTAGPWAPPRCAGSYQLGALAPDPPGQLQVLGLHLGPPAVERAQVGVLQQADQVALPYVGEQPHRRRGPLQVVVSKVLSDLGNEPAADLWLATT